MIMKIVKQWLIHPPFFLINYVNIAWCSGGFEPPLEIGESASVYHLVAVP